MPKDKKPAGCFEQLATFVAVAVLFIVVLAVFLFAGPLMGGIAAIIVLLLMILGQLSER